jgi:DNA-binding CsgD family transcriptional regulator
VAGGCAGADRMSRFPELTPRERDCLSWAAQGMTYQEIAGTLDVSPRTVEQHLASARSKLGAHSTAQAIAIATRRHMIAPTPIPAG